MGVFIVRVNHKKGSMNESLQVPFEFKLKILVHLNPSTVQIENGLASKVERQSFSKVWLVWRIHKIRSQAQIHGL